MLENPQDPGVTQPNQLCRQPVQYCTYWPMLGYFNIWNTTTTSNENTTSEDFEKIHQILLDGISANMASLLQLSKYGSTNTTYSTTMR